MTVYDLMARVEALEAENLDLKRECQRLAHVVKKADARFAHMDEQIACLCETLRPFAEYAALFKDDWPDTTDILPDHVNLGHCRRAKEALDGSS